MKNIGNKGFTLVELLATVVLLAIIVGIAAVSITAVMKNSKEKDYDLLIEEINNAVELYYQECKYSMSDMIRCYELVDGYYTITLSELVDYGFLKGNDVDTNNDSKMILVNPNDNVNISECQIRYKYTNGKVVVEAVNPTGSCPTSY